MNPAAPIANAILITGAGGRVGLHLAERMLDQQQQVGRHQEAARLQYGLVYRALQLGWARERILVIDEDLGRSGGWAWCSVSRCPSSPARVATGTSCSKSAPCRES